MFVSVHVTFDACASGFRLQITFYNGILVTSIMAKNAKKTILSKCIVSITHKEKTTPVLFVVADIDPVLILGLKTSAGLNLIQRLFKISAGEHNYVSIFNDCFSELGTPLKVHHITIDPNVRPVVYPP